MKKIIYILALLISSSLIYSADFTALLKDKSLRGGLCVVINPKNADSLIAARIKGKYLLQGVCNSKKTVDNIRAALIKKGVQGSVSVVLSDGKQLPYIDNLVNVVVLTEKGKAFPRKEIMRVLAPYGVALVSNKGKWVKVKKPYPEGMDEWPTFRHDVRRTNILNDKFVKVPGGIQWIAGFPMSTYMTNQVITSKGRIFYSRSRHMKDKKFKGRHGLLQARDAFNGILLWEKELKNGTPYARTCIATDGKRIYASLDESIAALDPATGKVLQDYKVKAQNVSYYNGKLILDRGNKLVDAATGKILWKNKLRTYYTEACLIDEDMIITGDKKSIVALDLSTGKELWRVKMDSPVTLVSIWKDMFFVLTGQWNKRTFHALRIKDGSQIWQREGKGFPAIVDNLGWVFDSSKENPKKKQMWIGLDPRTGKEKKSYPYGVSYVKGGRCYPARATEKYFMPNYGGLFFLDPLTGTYYDSFAGRGTCRFGLLPSNGMVYQPVHSCSCYPLTRGDAAFSTAGFKPGKNAINKTQLIKGPAFKRPVKVSSPDKTDWPLLRNDAERSGCTAEIVSKKPELRWQTAVAPKLSSLVVAGNKVYVSCSDQHQVFALNSKTGKKLWSYAVGGRVDSPPAVAGNLVLFGSADGLFYCLDSRDGSLRWRFRAAPIDRRIVCRGQIESVWPLHGSPLIVKDTVYLAAGRQAELNDGIFLYALNIADGRIKWKRQVKRPDIFQNRHGWSVDSCNNRILSYDGEAVHLDRHFYDPETGEEKDAVKGMTLWGGLLGILADNVSLPESHKGVVFKHWTYNRYHTYLKQTKQIQLRSLNRGNVLAIGKNAVFGIKQFYHMIYSRPKEPTTKVVPKDKDIPKNWTVKMPEDSVLNSLVIAGDTLIVGGGDSTGGKIWQFATDTGKKIGETSLSSVPRFDGIAVAKKALFISTEDGKVLCIK